VSSGEAEDIDNVIFLAFSSSFWIPDDTEDHNICMIEESGPLSASYQIHQCDQNGQKPVLGVTFQSWNWTMEASC